MGLPFLPPVHRSAVWCSMSRLQPSRQGRPDLGGPGLRSWGGAEFEAGGKGGAVPVEWARHSWAEWAWPP